MADEFNVREAGQKRARWEVIEPGASQGNGIQVVDKTITHAEMLALTASQVSLVPAVAGYANLVTGVYGVADLTAAYTVPAGMFLLITTPAARLASTFDGFREVASAGLLDQTGVIPFTMIADNIGGVNADPLGMSDASFLGGPLDASVLENQAVVLTNDRAGEYTGGHADNRIFLRIWYVTVPTTAN